MASARSRSLSSSPRGRPSRPGSTRPVVASAASPGSTAIEAYVGASSTLREAWADLPLTRQRAIVAAVLDRAVVRPAVRGRTTFDPDRVEPVWRL